MIIDPFPIIQKLDWVHSNFRSRWCSSLLCQAERVTELNWAEWFKCRILKLSSVCRQHIHTYTDWTMKMTHSLQVRARAARPCFLSTQLLGSAQCARTSHTQSVTYISHPDFKWSSRGSLKGQIGSVPSLSGSHSEPAIIPVYFLCWWLWHAVDM